MKAQCPVKCGKKFISIKHAEKHADSAHPDWRTPKSRGWCTPYGFVDFREPVTYEVACDFAKELREKFTFLEDM